MHKILLELVTQNHRFLLGDARQLCGSSRLRSDQSRFGYTKGLRQLLTGSSFAKPSEKQTLKLSQSGTASCLIMRIASSHFETLYAFGDLSSAA